MQLPPQLASLRISSFLTAGRNGHFSFKKNIFEIVKNTDRCYNTGKKKPVP